jgi:hypothetical protein
MLTAQKEIVTEIIAALAQKGKYQLSEIKQRFIERTAPVILGFFKIYDAFLAIKEQSITRMEFRILKR